MNVEAWVTQSRVIEARRPSAGRYRAIARHWAALTIDMLREASRDELEALLRSNMFGREKPSRGWRRGTHWEAVNVEARNRLARLAQAADRESIGIGHNASQAER